jgi:SAM-dependent methyltransferase
MAQQQWTASEYATHARFVSDLAEDPLAELLAIRPGERLLDLGCGDGALTARWVERGAVVVGVDESEDMVLAAQRRGVDARRMDARALPFAAEFDAVVSNAVLHWVPDLAPVLAGVRQALRPGGRFVGECGGHGCVAAVCTALRAVIARHGLDVTLPWVFRTAEDFDEQLREAGFEPTGVWLVPRPTPLPTGMEPWLRTFAGWAWASLTPDEASAVLAEVVDLLRPALCDSRGHWTADYVRVRFAAARLG